MKARPAKAPPVPAHPGMTVLDDEVVWDGRFPFQRVRFRYARFDGAESAELTWELWRRGRGCAVLPYDPVRDAVALIEQFRLPALAAGLPPVMTECPAGLVEPDEDPEDTARREVAEEASWRRTCPCPRRRRPARTAWPPRGRTPGSWWSRLTPPSPWWTAAGSRT